MSDTKKLKLMNVARELNLGLGTLADHLKDKGFDIDAKPTAVVTDEMYQILLTEFAKDKAVKDKAQQISLGKTREDIELKDTEVKTNAQKIEEAETVVIKNLGAAEEDETEDTPAPEPSKPKEEAPKSPREKTAGPKVVGKVDLDAIDNKGKKKPAGDEGKEDKGTEEKGKEAPTPEPEAPAPVEVKKAEAQKLTGPKVVGKIDLPVEKEKEKKAEPVASSSEGETKRKRRRKIRVKPEDNRGGRGGNRGGGKKEEVKEVSEKEIEDRIKSTMTRLGGGVKQRGSKAKYKKLKKERAADGVEELEDGEKRVLKVTEFISVSELGSLMDVAFTDVISKCMGLGIIVSINQRLDAEVIELVADEFGFEVQFINLEEQAEMEDAEEEEDAPEDLEGRPPIVTVMGHVDHGKTSLLDYIREENVIAGEAGGITQHIGAYEVELKDGRKITFLDTPGHEAFTAMRARGAKMTDVAVIVVAADDDVMPQTKEAISHAQAAGVPMIFAINKIDKEGANPDKIKEQLSGMNILVEDWGGKFQSQDISAKNGTNVEQILEKVLIEAEMLELKANPNKGAVGAVIEASLEKGKGYVATVLVQEGTMRVGDNLVAGTYYGKVKAMFNERGNPVTEAGPATPVRIMGLNGAPQAGETFKAVESDQEMKSIANQRDVIMREQGIRTQKHITLDEIGRRLALGSFKELNIIIRGDVDGSIEALGDSLQKLSTEEIQVNVVHKAVGQIVESDVMLASASDAVIIGFQVRPSAQARKLAEKENIEIRLYSVIYDAIEEVKAAMEGMLEPTMKEEIVGNVEIRDIFKVSKVGTIAGCYVTDGKIERSNQIRLIRDGIVIYTGELDSLKRFKDDAKDVAAGYECGLNIKNFNDIKVGDTIEAFKEVSVQRTL